MIKYLSKDYYSKVLQTYSDSGIENNWKALFIIIELFEQTSNELSARLKFRLDKSEQKNAKDYLKKLYEEY
jgi:aminoglycoside 6-adenylyltransferase